MKLMTKRLFAVVLTIAMTLGMAMSAMALDQISDANLEKVGIDPDKAVNISGWIDFTAPDEENANGNGSPTSGDEYAELNDDGTYTVDLSEYASSEYTKFAVVHNYSGNGQTITKGTSVTVDHLSPFCLVGEKKSGSSSSSSSSSKKSSSSSSSSSKSPKTGMDDSWMLWLMAAGVFAGTSVVAYNRKKNF